ncbi:MAG: 4-amino-4-deoxychorismate lyase [Gammaproteobacteria bacterium]|jgi:4-amino-4-deoxychorismate lyase
MAIKSLINGNSSDAISLYDRGLQYGDGLFETIAVEEESLLCWDEHIERLQSGCSRLKIPMPNQDTLTEEARRLTSSIERGIIKIIITRGQGGRGYALPVNVESTRIISLYPWPEYSFGNPDDGINVRVCNYRYAHNSILAGIKHLNRLEQVLARSEWTDSSIAEGVVLDHEENIIEGTMSNIFYIKNEILYTPELSACGVEGIIRQKIITLAAELHLEICINKISIESLMDADEAFMCNSIVGVWPIKMIDEKSLMVGDKTIKIKKALQKQNCIPTL